MPSAALHSLRQALASIEPHSGFPPGAEDARLPLGLPMVDGVLGGGLSCAALHELSPAAPAHLGAAFGFALAVAARAVTRPAATTRQVPAHQVLARQALLIETDFAGLEGGMPYGVGLDL